MAGLIIEDDDVCLFVTEKCNSNCIMCPMSMNSRKRGLSIEQNDWPDIVKSIPEETPHITITGGEPFLEYARLIPAMQEINKRFPNADILILSNGRALSIHSLFDQLQPVITGMYCFAIPIHASNSDLHDRITNTPGSFAQSMKALRRLSETSAKIEIRIVGHRLNLSNISNTFRMLVQSDIRIDVINLIAMEMMGCAAANRDRLWVDYVDLCHFAEEGIKYAMLHGVDVGLYNFPLCSVPKGMWPLVKQSITPGKARFYKECSECKEYYACGGLFFSTFELGLCNVTPFY